MIKIAPCYTRAVVQNRPPRGDDTVLPHIARLFFAWAVETLHPFPPLHSLPSSSPTGWQPAAPPTLGLLQTLHHMAFLWLLWSTLMAAPVQGIFDRNNHVQWYMINDHICPFCFSQILSSHSPLLLIGFESGRGGRVVRCGGKSSSLGSLLKVTRWNKLKCNLLKNFHFRKGTGK